MNDIFAKVCNRSVKFLKENAPLILSCVGAAGVIVTAVSAATAVPKAIALIEEKKQEKGGELTKCEKAVTAMPAYFSAAIIGSISIVCIISANILNTQKQSALIGGYMALHNAYDRYKNKVVEIYGEEAHKDILRKIAAEKSSGEPIYAPTLASNCCLDFEDTEEERLFYDSFSERYFQSTFSKVLQAEYHLNRNFAIGGEVCLNDFYDFLGILHSDGGYETGWSCYDGINWIDFDHSKTVLEDGLECYIIEMPFEPYPHYGYMEDAFYPDILYSGKNK